MDSIIQWARLAEANYYIDPSLKGPEKLELVDPNWDQVDKELEAFLEASDSDSEQQTGSGESTTESDTEDLPDQVDPLERSESDDDWLDNEIEAELEEPEVMVGTKKRKRSPEKIKPFQ